MSLKDKRTANKANNKTTYFTFCVRLPYGIGIGIVIKKAINMWVYVCMQVQGYIALHVYCLIARVLSSFY